MTSDTRTVKATGADTADLVRGLMPQPCQLVIFGAPGDLAWRKLLPAVYNLNVDGALPSHFAVVGFGLPAEGSVTGDPDEYLRNRARNGIDRFSRQALSEDHFADFARALFFVPGWIAWGLISIWFLYRIVRGMVNMNDNRPMPR